MEMFIPAGHVYQWIVKRFTFRKPSILWIPSLLCHRNQYWCALKPEKEQGNANFTSALLQKPRHESASKVLDTLLSRWNLLSQLSRRPATSPFRASLFGRQSCPHVHPSWTTSSAWNVRWNSWFQMDVILKVLKQEEQSETSLSIHQLVQKKMPSFLPLRSAFLLKKTTSFKLSKVKAAFLSHTFDPTWVLSVCSWDLNNQAWWHGFLQKNSCIGPSTSQHLCPCINIQVV